MVHAGVSLGGMLRENLIVRNTSYVLMIFRTRPPQHTLIVFGRLASQRLGCW